MQILHSGLFRFPASAVIGLVTIHELVLFILPHKLQRSKDGPEVDTKSLVSFQNVPLRPSSGQEQSLGFSQHERPRLP
jgi:hypothetical protein